MQIFEKLSGTTEKRFSSGINEVEFGALLEDGSGKVFAVADDTTGTNPQGQKYLVAVSKQGHEHEFIRDAYQVASIHTIGTPINETTTDSEIEYQADKQVFKPRTVAADLNLEIQSLPTSTDPTAKAVVCEDGIIKIKDFPEGGGTGIDLAALTDAEIVDRSVTFIGFDELDYPDYHLHKYSANNFSLNTHHHDNVFYGNPNNPAQPYARMQVQGLSEMEGDVFEAKIHADRVIFETAQGFDLNLQVPSLPTTTQDFDVLTTDPVNGKVYKKTLSAGSATNYSVRKNLDPTGTNWKQLFTFPLLDGEIWAGMIQYLAVATSTTGDTACTGYDWALSFQRVGDTILSNRQSRFNGGLNTGNSRLSIETDNFSRDWQVELVNDVVYVKIRPLIWLGDGVVCESIYLDYSLMSTSGNEITETVVGHTHAISDIENLQSQLNSKAQLANYIVREVPTGTKNGINTIFTLANTPAANTEMLFKRGLLMNVGTGNDYTITGNTITFAEAPLADSVLLCTYWKA